MKFLRNLFFGLVYALPAVLFFSYHPLISLGNDATMNFELSLPLIWLVLFDLVAVILLFSAPVRSSLRRYYKWANLGLILFPLYLLVSVFWSANFTRAILTAGVFGLTAFAIFALLAILPQLQPVTRFRQLIIKSIFLSTAAVCLFCWLQSILDVMGVGQEQTLLCPGCTYRTFGFPHPSGFAIEPQFMGNLLLAPTLLSLYLLAFKKQDTTVLRQQASSTYPEKFKNPACYLFTMIFSATLFLTLSRGAIYAYAVALAILFIFALIRHQRWLPLIAIPICTFFLSLTAQGIFSALSPTDDTFISGVTKVVHQLSLGIIDLRPETDSNRTPAPAPAPETANPETPSEPTPDSKTESKSESDSQFDGYISASTNIRLGLSEVALKTWQQHPIFGVGIGGAGVAMFAAFPDHELIAPNAIVQNEGISLLLELGLVGILLLILFFGVAFVYYREFWQHPALPLLLSLIIAYLITLQFFSGLANALQIYLLPPLLYIALIPASKRAKPKA